MEYWRQKPILYFLLKKRGQSFFFDIQFLITVLFIWTGVKLLVSLLHLFEWVLHGSHSFSMFQHVSVMALAFCVQITVFVYTFCGKFSSRKLLVAMDTELLGVVRFIKVSSREILQSLPRDFTGGLCKYVQTWQYGSQSGQRLRIWGFEIYLG